MLNIEGFFAFLAAASLMLRLSGFDEWFLRFGSEWNLSGGDVESVNNEIER